MKPITFTKSFIFDQDIVKVTDLLIEDDFLYEIKETDLVIKGKITGSGSAQSELDQFPLSFIIDVDCILSLTKIDCLTDLKLRFKDYRVNLDKKLVNLTLRYELLGNGEPYKEVITKENKDLQRDLYNAVQSTLPKEPEPFLDAAFKEKLEGIIGEDVEVISTFDSLEPLTSFDVNEDNKMIVEEELPVLTPSEMEVVLETPKPIDVVEEKPLVVPEAPKRDSIFKEERYAVAYIYYKAKDGDTYESIANIFKIDSDKLVRENQNKALKFGALVKIPKV